MKRLGQLLYNSAFDYKVYGVVMRDRNSSRVSVEVYVVSPEDEMSDIITLSRKDIKAKKNWTNVFYDLEGDFSREDIDCIRNAIMNALRTKGFPTEITQEKATMQELHMEISGYIRENAEELKDNKETLMFIREGYGYMATSSMEGFIKEKKDMGYKRLDVLKRLKIMGALQNGAGRAYDVQVSINGSKRHYYKIKLAEEKEDRAENGEECEVMSV